MILNESPLKHRLTAGTENPHTWIQNDSERIGNVSVNLQVLQNLTPEYTMILNKSPLLHSAGTENLHIWVQNDSQRITTASFNLQVLKNHIYEYRMILNESPLLHSSYWYKTRYTWVQNDSQRITTASNLQVLKNRTPEYRIIQNGSPLLHLTSRYWKTTHLSTEWLSTNRHCFNFQVLGNHTTHTRVQNDLQRSVQLCFSVTASEGDLRPFPLAQVNEKVIIIRSSAHSTIRSSYVSDRRLSLIIIPVSW